MCLTAAGATVGWFLAVSAASKLLDPMPTLVVLESVWGFSHIVAASAFGALVAIEIVLAFCVLARPGKRFVGTLVVTFIVVVTASPVRQILVGSSLPCGCGPAVLAHDPWVGDRQELAPARPLVDPLLLTPKESSVIMTHTTQPAARTASASSRNPSRASSILVTVLGLPLAGIMFAGTGLFGGVSASFGQIVDPGGPWGNPGGPILEPYLKMKKCPDVTLEDPLGNATVIKGAWCPKGLTCEYGFSYDETRRLLRRFGKLWSRSSGQPAAVANEFEVLYALPRSHSCRLSPMNLSAPSPRSRRLLVVAVAGIAVLALALFAGWTAWRSPGGRACGGGRWPHHYMG